MLSNDSRRTELPQVPGLTVEQELGRGAQGTVYRALRDGKAYALKLHHSPLPRDELTPHHIRFRREVAALARLNHPSLLHVFDVGELGQRPYLVMELANGQPLSELIAQGPLPEARVVEIGRAVAGALAEVNRCGLVHRDVKPKNILVQGSGAAKLIDFGFVTSTKAAEQEGDVAATLRYASPEQVGSLQRPVDGRSDLYSLGVVLFECLTGQPPFRAPNVGELARMHAAERPPDVRTLNPAVSERLAAIVARCLAKDPDDRFPDGDALGAALANEAPPDLSSAPSSDAANDDEATLFVGRGTELVALRSRWKLASGLKKGGFFIVEGPSGTGKSRLARELLRDARESAAVVLRAKSSPGDAVPFAAVRTAIDSYLSALSHRPEEERRLEFARIREAAAEFKSLLRRFSPMLSTVLGDHEATEHLGTQEQFLNAVAAFLTRIAAPKGGVLLLDDIQWLDDGSRSVLARLALELDKVPLLVLCTARSEQENRAAVERFAAELALPPKDRVQLGPLSRAEVGKLICGYLRAPEVDAELVDTVFVLSGGVPFAVSQFLGSMLDAGVLRPSWGRWVADRTRVEHLELPSDVIQLVVRRLDGLDDATKTLLTLASVVGSRFSPSLLALVAACPPDRVARAIAAGRRGGLLELADDDTYAFVHDRIREALLSRLDADSLREAHQRCADALEKSASIDAKQLFALAFHSAQGQATRHPERVFRSNWKAGEIAAEQFAYQEAHDFLSTSLAAAEAAQIAVPSQLHFLFGDICLRTSRLPTAERSLGRALDGATEPLERSRIHMALARVHSATAKGDKAQIEVELAFREAGERPPRQNPLSMGSSVAEWGLGLAAQWTGLGLASARSKKRARLSHLSELFNLAGYVGYLQMSESLMMQPCVRSLLPAHQLGPSREAVVAYASYTMVLGVLRNRRGVDAYIARARAISEQLGDRALLAVTEFYHSLAVAFCGDIQESTRLSERCTRDLGQWLDTGQVITLNSHGQHCLLARGKMREAWELTERNLLPYTRGNPHLANHPFIVCGAAAALSLLGKTAEAEAYFARGRTEEKEPGAPDVYWTTTIQDAIPYFLGREDAEQELEQEFARFEPYEREPEKMPYHPRLAVAFKVLARVEQLAKSPPEGRSAAFERLAAATKTLSKIAKVPVYESFLRLGRAALRAYEGRNDLARRELHRAWDLAEQIDSPLIQFEVLKLRARMLRVEGNHSVSTSEAQAARALAISEGWQPWERRLVREFDLEETRSTGAGLSSDTANVSQPKSIRTSRQLDSLLQVSLASASTSDLRAQARATLDELVRVLNAERGFLFLSIDDRDELQLVAARDGHKSDLAQDVRYSASAVQRVHSTGAPCVITGTEDGELSASASTVALGLRSIIAAPLRLQNRRIGVVYLDSRLAKGLFTADDVDILTAIANHISIALETSRATRLELERQTLEKDLAVTAAVQSLLLPKRDTYESPTARLLGYYRPAAQSGGDWWWYEDDGDELVVLVGDVTGHGAGSAMVSATVASAYSALRQEGRGGDTAEVLRAINRTLWGLCGKAYHMTLGAVAYRASTRTLRLWGAAAPPLLLLGHDGRFEGLPVAGTPLSSETFELGTLERQLSPGDRLLLYTDGLVEAADAHERQFGLRGIRRQLLAGLGKPLEEARQLLVDGLHTHARGRPLDDDVAFVLFETR